MCKCDPRIRTPFCGKDSCKWPEDLSLTLKEDQALTFNGNAVIMYIEGEDSKMNYNCRLLSVSQDPEGKKTPEEIIVYAARVSSPNQDNPSYANLLKYCIDHHHWSIFEMVTMCVEIETSRAIAQQILRHRSFSFQEFSQRYAAVDDFMLYEARRQDNKNRQNSLDDLPQETKDWFLDEQKALWDVAKTRYDKALEMGIAKECARFLLPLNVKTKMYMTGSIRSWIHYLQLRTTQGTQKEHMDIANMIKNIFITQFPNIASALEWSIK